MERLTIDLIDGATGSIPDRNTSKVRLALVLADQVLDCGRRSITVPAGLDAGEDTNVELRVLALGSLRNDRLPVVVVGGVGDLATRVVIELNEQGVELGVVDELLELEPVV